jgi:hypothetical protein
MTIKLAILPAQRLAYGGVRRRRKMARVASNPMNR